jgi:ribosomal protein S4E
MQKGNSVYIIGGTHVGEVAKVAVVIEGTMKRSKLVELTEGKEKFQTTEANVVVVDDGMLNWLKQTMHVTMNNTARANGGMQ